MPWGGRLRQIDLTSGSLTTSTDSIREQTEAWRLDALAAAETAAQISKVGALETTEGRKADAEINLAYAQSRMNTELEKILPAAQAMNEALTDNSTVARPAAQGRVAGFALRIAPRVLGLRAPSGSPHGRLLVGGRYDGTVEGARRLLTAYENQKGLLSFTNTDLTFRPSPGTSPGAGCHLRFASEPLPFQGNATLWRRLARPTQALAVATRGECPSLHASEKAYYETLKESVTAYDQAATEAASYQTEIDNLSAQIEAGKTAIDDYVTSLDQSAAVEIGPSGPISDSQRSRWRSVHPTRPCAVAGAERIRCRVRNRLRLYAGHGGRAVQPAEAIHRVSRLCRRRYGLQGRRHPRHGPGLCPLRRVCGGGSPAGGDSDGL